MPEAFCEPWELCERLGEVVMGRSLYGAPLTIERGALPLGPLQIHGAMLRPYLDLTVVLHWRPKGPCYGPIASVMSLAPGETVTLRVRERVERSLSDSVLEAALSSEVREVPRADGRLVAARRPDQGGELASDQMERQLNDILRDSNPQQISGSAPRSSDLIQALAAAQEAENLDTEKHRATKADDVMRKESSRVEMAPAAASRCGSFWRDLGMALSAVALGPAGPAAIAAGEAAGEAIAKEVDGFVDRCVRGSNVIRETGRQIEKVLKSVERTEKRRSERVSHERETTVTRTFRNPYQDRSLQLRFMPVFQQYEVGLEVDDVEVGVALAAGPVAQPGAPQPWSALPVASHAVSAVPRAAVAPQYAHTAAAMATLASHRQSEALHLPMAAILQKYTGPKETLHAGFNWSSSWVKDSAVHVPLAPVEDVASAWALPDKVRDQLEHSVGGIQSGQFDHYRPTVASRTVSMFIGMHVEPVPGECVLPHLPPVEEGDDS